MGVERLGLPPALAFAHPTALLLLLALPAVWRLQARQPYSGSAARRLALALRLGLTTLLALGLAQPAVSWPTDRAAVVFLLDGSDSVTPQARQHALDWIAAARQSMQPADLATVVRFGARPVVEELGKTARVDGTATDLAGALRLAGGLLPADGGRQVVLLSDGQAGSGSARDAAVEEALRLASRGIRLDAVPLERLGGLVDARVEAVEAPARVREGDDAEVAVVVGSETAGRARVRLWTDDRLIADQSVDLQSGTSQFVLGHAPQTQGFHRYRARVDLPGDAFPQNDELAGYTVVAPRPTVLVVPGPTADVRPLQSALASQGIVAAVQPPDVISPRPSGLLHYDGVVLDNVPAASLGLDQMKTLESYVRDFGRGLVAVGGERSYAPGGYADTPLDGVLPVSAKVPMIRRKVPVALLLLIDASESMSRGNARGTKMAMAKQAAADAVSALEDDDQVAVMIFDTRTQVVVPFERVGDAASRERIRQLIARIAPGGGTDIYSSLQAGLDLLGRQTAQARHLVLLTDGRVYDYRDYGDLVQTYRRQGITLSGIAIGDDADAELLRWLAERGGGRYYFTGDPSELPKILVEETRLTNRPALVEQPFQPLASATGEALGLLPTPLPKLGGYVLTSPKPTASVTLSSPQGDAVLAEWQYGLGRVLAWTSDADRRWSGDWLKSSEFARFWSQAVRWTLPSPLEGVLRTRVDVAGGQVIVSADATSEGGQPASLRDTRAVVTGPDGQQATLTLRQVAPGHYEAAGPAGPPGAYSLWVGQYEGGELVAEDRSGFVVPYPAEYRRFGADRPTLRELARATGGDLLDGPASAFVRSGATAPGRPVELWSYCLLASLLLFVAEVALRLRLQRVLARR